MSDEFEQERYEDKKPILESIDDIELEIDVEEQAGIQADMPESEQPVQDASVMLGGIAAAVCGIADAVCESKGVDTLNKSENKALSGAIVNVIPHFVTPDMTAKQAAVLGLCMVSLGIASPRLAQMKNGGKAQKKAIAKADNVETMADYIAGAESVE